MIANILKKVFGSRNDRLLKQYRAVVNRINALESGLQTLDDAALAGKTAEFRARVEKGERLDSLLPEAFAVCREASRRVMGMRHFDVQLIGGMVLHDGKIAEMRTGEGKTLVATLPAYLNALAGKGVHVVTVNDYLASRDAGIMAPLYNFLGLSVGVNLSQMPHDAKQDAYAADITYGTNNEFGFDYLRDNMVYSPAERVQKPLSFAIVDEVDSILIDEARTPLIISGPADDNVDMYRRMNAIPALLVRQQAEDGEGDYWVDEKAHTVMLSEAGFEHAEAALVAADLLKEGESLYSAANITLMHHLMAALRAHALFHRDQHYVVQDGEIVIVDEFTGRLMAGRRWSEGLHQAVEAKEGVNINRENQTLASITFQNYFRLYKKLAGMTGTADTEAYEFQQIYGLETVVIPTNRPMVRKDSLDLVYRTGQEKYNAILADITDCHQRGQPVLVGTTSIENSELLAGLLKQAGLPHNVLNAKEHAREADIIVQAGRPGVVTVATNMAGRGTDIVLGGNIAPEIKAIESDESLTADDRAQRIAALKAEWQARHDAVLAAGGLHIIGTERHESRRIDNQLRGRSGRQGDPGSSRFYLSLEDPLLRIFASERVSAIMQRLNMPEGEAIEHSWVTRAIENAQRKVEGRNFDIRKQLLEYDDVANDQRRVIYQQRNEILESEEVSDMIAAMRDDVLSQLFDTWMPPQSIEEQWDAAGLMRVLEADYQISVPLADWIKAEPNAELDTFKIRILEQARALYDEKVAAVGAASMQQFERAVLLQHFDGAWREHLAALDHLRQGIHLRGYAQKNPKQEYKREAFELFSLMLDRIKREVTQIVATVQIRSPEEAAAAEAFEHEERPMTYRHDEFTVEGDEAGEGNPFTAEKLAAAGVRVGRNDPCPCGSGKRYKQCHGRLA
ncbi:preprotein translocase subunit SecA [Laribacter hongkongensis]|uniref:Protein translocase subunit SecA n=1 Tax=Laribacter hongkongensis (strain HLHK9) TaxID=557598 RepID=SECA_LARHH|nr:preprotein translocase subunit SecA [Laribacter hongkongensis]C1D5K2.1 RecName: Full=Protein translocase subunit SecA [Laribacter hongkongensis HLHK9]ACO76019.1 Protein translocase subunit secA [Laribacter hongkongensis HLHK9]MCG9083108.1 preprotein translocase subunit SecA [Laribacter hongkongensis]MCG9107439.1 preprotein translocase subunit SecA [Laribacter hongkongensis]MCG9114680.1 preprotein translocase subunit SecA [Laribacter hongkongensis]MCG9123805.1 preprotein translocase subunit